VSVRSTIERIVGRCLQKQPGLRFQTMAELAKAIGHAEQQIFGSTNLPSSIALRLDNQPTAISIGKPDWVGGPNHRGPHGAHYLLGQGLWHFQRGLTRPFVPPATEFSLRIKLSNDTTTNTRFLLALWAWLTYGGLGARTRRGFGQIACTAVDNGATHPILTDLVTPRTARQWTKLGGCAIPPQLRDPGDTGWPTWMQDPPAEDHDLPDLPTLAPRWWAGTLINGGRSLGAALGAAGQDWREFRVVTPPLSPEWKHAIHGNDRRYPIAALGLPVGYHSARSRFTGTVEPRFGTEVLRRASPVWLRPVQIARDDWRVFTHVFYARLLPDGATLRITGDGHNRELDSPDRDQLEYAWDAWLDGARRLPGDFYRKT